MQSKKPCTGITGFSGHFNSLPQRELSSRWGKNNSFTEYQRRPIDRKTKHYPVSSAWGNWEFLGCLTIRRRRIAAPDQFKLQAEPPSYGNA